MTDSRQSSPQRVGGYILDRKIGAGGMAEIFLAHKDSGPDGFKRKVVLKKILPHAASNPMFVKRFIREASLAAQFHHPNIVEIYDMAAFGDESFIVMEYLEGHNFDAMLMRGVKTGQRCPPWIAARVIADAAGALHYAHTFVSEDGTPRSIVHRDVSPDNIMVTSTGQVKVLDFGIAKDPEAATKLTQAGEMMGKPVYFAPEIIKGKPPAPQWDIYALGATLYEALAGRPPFQPKGTGMAAITDLLVQIAKEPPPPLHSLAPDTPRDLQAIVERAMDKRPRKRQATAADLQADLEGYIASCGQPASPATVAAYVTALFSGAPMPAVVGTDSPASSRGAAKPATAPRPARSSRSATRPGVGFWLALVLAFGVGVGGAALYGSMQAPPALAIAADPKPVVRPALAVPAVKPASSNDAPAVIACKAGERIFVNKDLVGTCPMEQAIELPSGAHQIVFRGGGAARKHKLTVEPGQHLTVSLVEGEL